MKKYYLLSIFFGLAMLIGHGMARNIESSNLDMNYDDVSTENNSTRSQGENCISSKPIYLKKQEFERPVYNFSVREETMAGGCIVKINSNYDTSWYIWYTVNDTSTFSIFNRSIIFLRRFDYEEKTVYYLNLTAHVQKKENHSKINLITTKLIINIIDINDEWPFHYRNGDILVPENNPIGAHIMKVNATDKDISNEFNQITYTLKNNYEFFKIDNKTGDVTALIKFDSKKKSYYVLNIMASDNSPTAVFKNGLSVTTSYRIQIVDENDDSPEFRDVILEEN